MSEHKPSQEVQGIVCRPPRQDCIEAQIWGRVQKNVCSTECSQEHSVLQWKKFGATRTLPRAGRPAKLSNRCRKALEREVTTNWKVPQDELQRSCVEMGETSRRTTFTATKPRSVLQSGQTEG